MTRIGALAESFWEEVQECLEGWPVAVAAPFYQEAQQLFAVCRHRQLACVHALVESVNRQIDAADEAGLLTEEQVTDWQRQLSLIESMTERAREEATWNSRLEQARAMVEA